MNELSELRNKLEDVNMELIRTENLISLALMHLFEEKMTPYAQLYEAVLDSAWRKVNKQAEIVENLILQVHQIKKIISQEEQL